MDNQLHVLPENDQWIIRRSGDASILDRCPTVDEARQNARLILRPTGGRIVVHGGTGGRFDETVTVPRRLRRAPETSVPMFG